MNRKEIAEIRRRLNPDKNNISCIRGCYVNEKREVISSFNQSLMSLPQEEAEKYLAIFRRTLTGLPGRNLLDISFRPDQVMDSDEHRLLSGLRNTALKVEEGVNALYQRIIDSLELEGNYLILMMHDAYDVPFQTKDDLKMDDASEEVFSYILLSVCPVKLTKPALSYDASDNEFHTREQDWVVAAPELGFMFPTFDDRTSNIYSALYFTRDAADNHTEFIDAIFRSETPRPAAEQKQAFEAVLEDALEDDLNYDVVQTVHEQIRSLIEEKGADKAAEPPTVNKREVSAMLEACGVPEEKRSAFEEKYEAEFGPAGDLTAVNLVNAKQFQLRTPDVVIQVNPERSDLVETRIIDGRKYILICADEGVEVNGLNISIADEAEV